MQTPLQIQNLEQALSLATQKYQSRLREKFEEYSVGNTPLSPLQEFLGVDIDTYGSEIYVKDEGENPQCSVKDRTALSMLVGAETVGIPTENGGLEKLAYGQPLVEPSSGNTGIGLAYYGWKLSHPITIILPENAKTKAEKIISLGGETELAEADGTSDSAIDKANRFLLENPKYRKLDQYSNPFNFLAHYFTTGEEIWRQTNGKVSHAVIGKGTCGTIIGVGRKLKEYNPEIQVIGVEPYSSLDGFAGLKNMNEAKHIPPIYAKFKDGIIDYTIYASGAGFDFVKKLYNGNYLKFPAGLSSVATLVASLELANQLEKNKSAGIIVTIFADKKDNYLDVIGRI